MGWGGAPPWVYKNEIAYHSSQANQYSAEASRAKEIATRESEEKEKCQKRLRLLQDEILKLESLVDQMRKEKEIKSITAEKIISKLNDFKHVLSS